MTPLLLILAAATAQYCAPVELSVAGGPKTFVARFANNSAAFRATAVNFQKAYAKACSEAGIKSPLISAKASDRKHLFLVNAPDANIASIYLSKRRAVLEYWFVTHDGKIHVPTSNELHEAIYCVAHGASAKEQQESGRCLPD